MDIAIIILLYLVWISNFIQAMKENKAPVILTGILVTLVSWKANTPWGIVMCVITTLASFLCILNAIVEAEKKKAKNLVE